MKKLISYIITFIFVISLASSILLSIIANTIFNENFFVRTLEKSSYYLKTYNEIMENFKNNTVQAGLEEDVLEGILSQEKVREDINLLVIRMYKETEISINSEEIKEKLKNNIDKVIKENNKQVTEEEQSEIEIYLDTIGKIYEEGIVYSEKYVKEVQRVLIKVQKVLYIARIASYIACGIVLLLIILINKMESKKYFSIAFIATGMILLIPKIFTSITMKTQNILILNQAFSSILITIVEHLLMSSLICGIICIVIGILISIFTNMPRREY